MVFALPPFSFRNAIRRGMTHPPLSGLPGIRLGLRRRGRPVESAAEFQQEEPRGAAADWQSAERFLWYSLAREVSMRKRAQPFALFTAAVSLGTISNRSPTTPRSATSKIGASGSLLIAMMKFDVFMPTRCWIAPEMPQAT